ncbi:MAG: dihydrolipoyl dehydrogenase [Cytophagales bacterium]|nr:dihydrolipoyl dehydrogenase [Cytophagales bacterium]
MYDLAVIGSGPGGYVCAIRAAQLGFKVVLLEKYASLGGTCLNVGCIPSKSLLDSSEHYYNAQNHFKGHGILCKDLSVDLSKMMARKDSVLRELCQGVAYLLKKNKVDVQHGHASFEDPHKLLISGPKGEKKSVQAKYIVIATGSKPISLPFAEIDKKRIITSTEALSLKEIPQNLIVIGGGVIGMELGSVYARLGTQVSVVEYASRLIPSMDAALGKELQSFSQKRLGMEFFMRHKVTQVKARGKGVELRAESPKGDSLILKGDYALVSVGRKPYTEGLGLEKVGIQLDEKGRIPVTDRLNTQVPHIFALGDVIRGPMLAHKAEEEGVLIAEQLAGQKPHVNYLLIPNVVYTWPEVSGVGYTEEELKEKGISYKTGHFPFKALGRAKASGDQEGFVKILAHLEHDEILGVHIFGARAADMISEGVLAMEYRASAEDVARTSHAHPTYSEAFKEACLAATENRAIHV